MKWIDFYDHFCEWDGKRLLRELGTLTEFGPSTEVVEVLESIPDGKAACEFLLRACEAGTVFSGNELTEIAGWVDEKTLNKLIRSSLKSGVRFSEEQIAVMSAYVDREALFGQLPEATPEEHVGEKRPSQKKAPGILTGILALAGISEEYKSNKTRRFRIGDHVRVRYRGQEGTVVDVNGDYYMVSLNDGRHVDSYREEELEKAW